jgi:hypothetical protein
LRFDGHERGGELERRKQPRQKQLRIAWEITVSLVYESKSVRTHFCPRLIF